ERLLSPKLFPGSSIGPDVVVGANAYHSGKTAHIAGISARGNTLVIRLVKPTPTLPWVLADVPYCAVPASTPVVSGGVETPIPAARLLSPRAVGFSAKQAYPLRGDLRTARRLAGGRALHAVFATFEPTDPYSVPFVKAVRDELAAVGITVTVLPLTNADFDN